MVDVSESAVVSSMVMGSTFVLSIFFISFLGQTTENRKIHRPGNVRLTQLCRRRKITQLWCVVGGAVSGSNLGRYISSVRCDQLTFVMY